MTEPLRLEFAVGCSPEHAFEMWATRASLWWPHDHSVSAEPGISVTFEPRAGGRIYERTRAGVEHDWGRWWRGSRRPASLTSGISHEIVVTQPKWRSPFEARVTPRWSPSSIGAGSDSAPRARTCATGTGTDGVVSFPTTKLRAANVPATQSPEADARSCLERRASDRSKYEGQHNHDQHHDKDPHSCTRPSTAGSGNENESNKSEKTDEKGPVPDGFSSASTACRSRRPSEVAGTSPRAS